MNEVTFLALSLHLPTEANSLVMTNPFQLHPVIRHPTEFSDISVSSKPGKKISGKNQSSTLEAKVSTGSEQKNRKRQPRVGQFLAPQIWQIIRQQ